MYQREANVAFKKILGKLGHRYYGPEQSRWRRYILHNVDMILSYLPNHFLTPNTLGHCSQKEPSLGGTQIQVLWSLSGVIMEMPIPPKKLLPVPLQLQKHLSDLSLSIHLFHVRLSLGP